MFLWGKKEDGGPYHLCQPSGRDDIARMYKAVEMASRLFYRLAHLIVAVQIEDVGDQVQGILIVLNLDVQAGQVESVCQVLFVDLAEVFVAPRGYKLRKRRSRRPRQRN